jgi:hypothetical protein
VKPGDHPEFFRRPPPAGRSRESTIVLDARGRFWHDGELVENPAMSRAFASWIRRHPDDGRYILSNGYDWTYFTVLDAPFWVQSARVHDDGRVTLALSDGSQERLEPSTLVVGDEDSLYVRVKNGQFEARFSPAAQLALADSLVPIESSDGREHVGLRIDGELHAIGRREANPNSCSGA